jgi:hypothetical protein
VTLTCTPMERDLLTRIKAWVEHARVCDETPCDVCDALGQMVVAAYTLTEQMDPPDADG